ncbi:MAG: stage III sporulation protein AB [Candidatus Limivicinus sp.]|nr:stage III sporulation protein AB [Candidatus Limivicinus sp.]
MDSFETACQLLPTPLRRRMETFTGRHPEEIRLRLLRPPSLVINGRELELPGDRLSENELNQVLERATGASLHAAMPGIVSGYIGYKGLRIGLCGSGIMNHGQLAGFRDFSSLAIRLPRECRGICNGFIDRLTQSGLENTLIVSPPGLGKTTLLRELIRVLSDRGTRVAVLDERNELSASTGGKQHFDLGRCSDVLVGVPKGTGVGMLLRGMNPQVIAMDEISAGEEKQVIERIIGCGVSILASAHGRDRHDMLRRPMYRELFEMGAFSNVLTISRDGENRRYSLERLE